MNAFDSARTVESRSMAILRPFIQQRAFNGQYVVTSKGPLARELQTSVGDILFNAADDSVYGVEVKAEESAKWGNFFFETWSNLSRFTPGWMFTLKADLLLYHFLEDDLLYSIPFSRLKRWAFGSLPAQKGRIYDFPERTQSKRPQANDTWGRCVPIDLACREIGLPPPFRPLAHLEAADEAAFAAKYSRDAAA